MSDLLTARARHPRLDKKSSEIKERSRLSKEEWREFTKTVWQVANTSDPNHPAVFPEEIPRRLIKLFTFVGETVLDPFAGTGTTGKAALSNDRRAILVDQNARYVSLMRRNFDHRNGTGKSKAYTVNVLRGDARDMRFLRDESVSLVVTSPPYWNKADYGVGTSNIGSERGYRRFLDTIRPAFKECFRVLQQGRKLCVVTANVNQQTDHGLLTFPLATDFTNILREEGFVMVNELVWSKYGTGGKWGSWGHQRPIFGSYPYPPNFHFKNVHEYILVFAKPNGHRTRGPKVIPYDDLMSSTPT